MKIRSVGTSLIAAAVAVFAAGSYVIAAQDVKSQWEGMFTVEQAGRGKMLYSDRCSACHGEQGAGSEMAPGLTNESFATKWNDSTMAEVFERIRTTMPQNDPGSLTPPQTADILAFILSEAKFPAGMHELPSDTVVLKTYKFLAKKPN